jgi:protein TonB
MSADAWLRRAALALAALAAAAVATLWVRFHYHYYTAAEVDRGAFPLKAIVLPYPPASNGVERYGKVELEVYIDEQGRVDRVELLDSTVPPAYQEVALREFRDARFGPALRGGRPVKSVKKIEVQFTPPVGDARPLR